MITRNKTYDLNTLKGMKEMDHGTSGELEGGGTWKIRTLTKFVGGVLDGKKLEVDENFSRLNVPIREGMWADNDCLEQWQVYERVGSEMVYLETKTLW